MGIEGIGGTGVSGVSGGVRLCQSVAFSYALAKASTRLSEKCGPAIVSPIGNPVLLKPHGTEMAGRP